ncbi:MAG: bifunctional glycosyltransferase family 2 protein/CDP-glycerol:glycerophosphate glycerophosphotransferase [Mogibacterium sp.]|nr:bifunctional glycosyltransferase family 2 protein/CDP-glycerol:glycerophosphate glycerophosphotransferase [Mogibacterium sp.]
MIEKPKFSVIIPVHNSCKTVAETIESVINQTIGFENNIHLVVVDDGSTDASCEVIKKYVSLYPDNIEYIYQKNQGVAVARNTGLERARGRYINFLDAEDLWDNNAFEKTYTFFEENYDEIDIIATRIRALGGKDGYHFLDYKFTGDRIVDIQNEYKVPQMSLRSTFIKHESLKDIKAEALSSINEDVLIVTEVIFRKSKIGLLRSVDYLYRKNIEQILSTDRQYRQKDSYINVPPNIYGEVLRQSENRFGCIIPYAQYLVANDISLKLKTQKIRPTCLCNDEWLEFIQQLHIIMDQIDDSYFLGLKKVSFVEKAKCLKFKNGDNYDCSKLLKKIHIKLDILEIRKGRLYLSGRSFCEYLSDEYSIYIQDLVSQKKYFIDNKLTPAYDTLGVDGEILFRGTTFEIVLPINNRAKYVFYVKKDGEKAQKVTLKKGAFSRLSKLEGSYFVSDNKIIYHQNNSIIITEKTLKKQVSRNIRLIKEIRSLRVDCALAIRRHAKLLRIGKPIWLIYDRADRAGDNAEALFKFLQKTNAKKKYRLVFAVSKRSSDYGRMKQFGKVVDWESERFKEYFIAADKIISSQWSYGSGNGATTRITNPTLNPFGEDRYVYQDLLNSDFVFLQHGITKDDISSFGHRNKRNVKLFITAAKKEYKSIAEGNYGYQDNQVVLTGFPRYDDLCDKRQNILLFLPTWRQGIQNYNNEEFCKTEYYIFYEKLINDKDLIHAMEEKGYHGLFCVHPVLMNNGKGNAFKGNDTIKIINKTADYTDLFKKGALLITDYSSVAMDFAYLKKPVVYSQFDKDSFFSNHTYTEGYFSYERDGFGSVCYDYDTTVRTIIDLIKHNCEMDNLYKNRVKDFFAYNDNCNCQRVYKEIEKM